MYENTAGVKKKSAQHDEDDVDAQQQKKLLKNLLDSPHFHFDSNLKLPTSPGPF